MNIKSRGKKLVNSFKYAFNGFKLTFKNEQNMVIHIIVATIVTICAFISQKMDISDIYSGVIIDTYRKGKYKPILEELGCCKSSFDDDYGAFFDMINNRK